MLNYHKHVDLEMVKLITIVVRPLYCEPYTVCALEHFMEAISLAWHKDKQNNPLLNKQHTARSCGGTGIGFVILGQTTGTNLIIFALSNLIILQK